MRSPERCRFHRRGQAGGTDTVVLLLTAAPAAGFAGNASAFVLDARTTFRACTHIVGVFGSYVRTRMAIEHFGYAIGAGNNLLTLPPDGRRAPDTDELLYNRFHLNPGAQGERDKSAGGFDL